MFENKTWYPLPILAMTLLLLAGCGRATEKLPVNATGEDIFTANCAICHSAGSPMGIDRIANGGKFENIDRFKLLLRHPPSGMPTFPESQLGDADVKKLYDYVIQTYRMQQPAAQ